MRAAQRADLGIESGGFNGKIVWFRNEIADIAQEEFVALRIVDDRPVAAVPVVDFALQIVAAGQQGGVGGAMLGHQRRKAGPELLGSHRKSRQGFIFDEIDQQWMHRKSGFDRKVVHGDILVDESGCECGFCWRPSNIDLSDGSVIPKRLQQEQFFVKR